MTPERLAALLQQDEDAFVERKTSGQPSDVTKALVAFANSVPPGREGVLFIGQRANKEIVGVPNSDELQRKVTEWAKQCYPPVPVHLEILTVGAAEVVAVVVPASKNRPHFAGKAYKRVGSRTEEASAEMLDEMIASRNDKAGLILGHKGETITVDFRQEVWTGQWNAPEKVIFIPNECSIEGCTAHSVQLRILGSGRSVSIPLEHVSITVDTRNHRPLRLSVASPMPI